MEEARTLMDGSLVSTLRLSSDPVELYAASRIERLESQVKEMQSYGTSLKFIATFGGKTVDGISCNGTWASEMARSSLNQKDRESLQNK